MWNTSIFKYLLLQINAQKLYQIYEITQTFLQYYFRSLDYFYRFYTLPPALFLDPGSIKRGNLRRGLSEAWKRWTLGLIYLSINCLQPSTGSVPQKSISTPKLGWQKLLIYRWHGCSKTLKAFLAYLYDKELKIHARAGGHCTGQQALSIPYSYSLTLT